MCGLVSLGQNFYFKSLLHQTPAVQSHSERYKQNYLNIFLTLFCDSSLSKYVPFVVVEEE